MTKIQKYQTTAMANIHKIPNNNNNKNTKYQTRTMTKIQKTKQEQ
jgi:hypothetical protein